MDDPYLDIIDEHWNNIATLYLVFQKIKPIIVYDIHERKVYSYPAKEYINGLSGRTREKMKKQYRNACKNNKFILFIKDTETQRLRSYVLDVPELEEENHE
jgi:hypothetical protein